jgi:hypothetical protein
MNNARRIISLTLVFALVSLGLTAQAQLTRNTRYQQDQLIRRVENDATRFRTTLADAMNNSNVDNTRREQNGDIYVSDLLNATAQLRDRFNRRQATASDVQLVLDRATLVNNFLRRSQLGGQVDTDWTAVSADLTELANAYGIRWRGYANNRGNNPNGTTYGNNGGYNNNGNYGNNGYGNYGARLTGTYRLDASRSDDPANVASLATRSLPYNTRQQTYDELLRRLTAPDALAIDQQGTQVSIASTRAPQFTLVADGTERVEQTPNGRTVRARASLAGNQLNVSTTGDRNSDFTVTFTPIDGGRSLEVTRRISDINLRTPATVRSVYTRSADVAQFDIYQGGNGYGNSNNNYPNNNYPNNTTTASGDFIVPDGATLVATLNQDLSTATTTEGTSFSMTVSQPAEWAGAIIDGHVSHIARSGRVTGRSEMTLNFDHITQRDGRAYSFSGFVDGVRATNGQTVRVDNEGTVQDSGSQTTRTEERAAIGTAVGAIIGAIASGGKGAAIGAILGGGAGAGSVYAQGRDDLSLPRGTEVTIRASSPQRNSR